MTGKTFLEKSLTSRDVTLEFVTNWENSNVLELQQAKTFFRNYKPADTQMLFTQLFTENLSQSGSTFYKIYVLYRLTVSQLYCKKYSSLLLNDNRKLIRQTWGEIKNTGSVSFPVHYLEKWLSRLLRHLEIENKIIRDKLTHLLNMVEVRKSIDLFGVKIQNFRFKVRQTKIYLSIYLKIRPFAINYDFSIY